MADLLLGVKIRADGAPQTVREIKRIDDQVKALQEQNRRVANTAAALKDAYDLSDAEVKQLTNELLRLEQQTGQTARQAGQLNGILAGFASAGAFAAISAIGQAFQAAGRAIQQFVADALAANLQLTQTSTALAAIYQQQGASIAEANALAAESIDFVRAVVDRTGQSFQTGAKSYAQLSAAAQSAGVSQAELNDLFTESNRVFGIFGLSAERADLAFQAISQILGKNQLSLEELRQQLGESLPIALQATADGLGVTVAELNELVAAGEVSGREFALAFTAGLREVPGEVSKLQASINGLQNQLFFLSAETGKAFEPIQSALLGLASDVLAAAADASTGFDPLIEAGERFNEVLEANPEIAEELGRALAAAADAAVELLADGLNGIATWLEENPDKIADLADNVEELADLVSATTGTIGGLLGILEQLNAPLDAISERFPRISEGFRQGLTSAIPFAGQIQAIRTNLQTVIDLMERAGLIAPEQLEGNLGGAATAPATALGEAREALADLAGEAEQPEIEPPLPPEEELERRVSANKSALQQIETDALNARAALLETGGTQEQIAAEEKAALESRIAENERFRAQLADLQRQGLEGEDAAAVAGQIADIDRQLAQDRVNLAQQVVDAQQRAEEQRIEAAKESAKEVTDALKAERDERRRLDEQAFSDSQAQQGQQFGDRQRQEQRNFQKSQQSDADAFRDAQEAAAESFQDGQQADAEAFQKRQEAAAESFQQRQQERENAFRQQQEAAAEAFQQRQQEARDKANREFDALAAEVENRIALANASSAQERREIQERIRQEQEAGQQRRTIEQQVLAERGSVLGAAEARGELELSPLEQARADFEARLQEEAKAFADQQQAEREEFEAQQREVEKAFQEGQREQAQDFRIAQEEAADQFAERQRQAERDFRAGQEQEAEDFAERQRQAERDFQAQQQEAERRFKDEQRRLDEESAQRIAGILERAEQGIAPPALREGGPVEAGKLYQVHKDEFFVPRTDGTILNQQASRQVVREALTVRQIRTLTAPIVASAPNIPQPSPAELAMMARDVKALLKEVKQAHTVPLPPAQYSLSTPQPMEDAAALEMARLRYWASRRGL